jgi:hypothetical protein
MDLGSADLIIDVAIIVAVVAILMLFVVALPRSKKRQTLSLTEVQEGLHRTGIVTIEGGEPGAGLSLYIRNRGRGPLLVQGESGTVIEASDSQHQDLIAHRPQTLEVPNKSTRRLDLEILSLAARKEPPGRHGAGGYRVCGLAENDEILDLLEAVDRLEAEASRYVTQFDGEKVRHRPMSDDLVILTAVCTCQLLESGAYRVRVPDEVIQYALWQITDRLSFDALVELVVQPPSPEGRLNLVGKVLAANVLLEAVGVKPTSGL